MFIGRFCALPALHVDQYKSRRNRSKHILQTILVLGVIYIMDMNQTQNALSRLKSDTIVSNMVFNAYE